MSAIAHRIVARVAHLLPGGPAAVPKDPTGQYDVMIGDIPFMAAYSDNAPLMWETAPYRKEQQDQSAEPGEQSLTGWWRRSQTSFHGGAGRDYEEPRSSGDTSATIQFKSSQGVDVWTPGKVKLLHAPVTVTGTGDAGCVAAGSGVLSWGAAANTLRFTTMAADTPTTATVNYGDTGNPVLAVASDGSHYWVATSGGVWSGTLSPVGVGAKVWNAGPGPTAVLGWVKQRLMYGSGPAVYQLAGGTPPTLPTAAYTHPNASWKWTGFCAGPTAIYAAGYCGDTSALFSFELDTSGDVPVLVGGAVALEVPVGEQILSVGSYISGYVILGTNLGIRVCTINTAGDLILGPLSLDYAAAGLTAGPVHGVTGRSRYTYGTFSQGMPDGTSGLVRLDLHQLDSSGLHAWATDLQSHSSGDVTGVTCLGGTRMAWTTSGAGLQVESASALEDSGVLTTGRIRFHTLEPKLFKQLRLRALPLLGNVQAAVLDSGGGTNLLPQIIGLGQGVLPVQDVPLDKQEYVSLQFTLFRSGTDSPVLTGYQLNALPAAGRQRQTTLVLSCYDGEEDWRGHQVKRRGFAMARLLRLRALENAGDRVLLQHLHADPDGLMAALVVIDSVRFVQGQRPATSNGWGGSLEVVLRDPS